jgi:hypothetical protein
MRPRSVKFSDSSWAMVRRAARREGITASQYIREAVLMRAFYEAGYEREPALKAAMEELMRMRQG